MQDLSKKQNDKIFALRTCVDVVVAGKNDKGLRKKLWNGTIARKQKPKYNRAVPV